MLRKLVPYLSLFTSLGTLVCCALPALFVSLGLGATFVSLLGVFPQLIWISEHKTGVFLTAGFLLAAAVVVRVNAQAKACPADPALAASCERVRGGSGVVLYLSVACYLVGAFFAFVAPLIF